MSLPRKSAPETNGDELAKPPWPVNRALRRTADAGWRLAIYLAYRLLLLWWRVRRPRHEGALVALWHAGAILLIRSSYRRSWSLPGGGVGKDEMPRSAALRELDEELGVVLPESALRFVAAQCIFWEYRHDRTLIFEAELREAPRLRPDNREIIAAIFQTPAAAMALDLTPPLRAYLAAKDTHS
jgi:ADP-ribose pyrophosphatase YjhB (NUDIX family)